MNQTCLRFALAQTEPQLSQAIGGVLQAPCPRDSALHDAEEVHLRHVREPAAGGWMAEPGVRVGARAGEPSPHSLALSDQLNDPHLDVTERVQEGFDPTAGLHGMSGHVQLIEDTPDLADS